MTRSALITGGAGFIGSHVADRLLEAGCGVAALDNFAIGREANVAHLEKHPQFSMIRGDVTDPALLSRIASERGVDTIFHFAAVHYIPFCTAHPYEAVKINVLGTQAAIDAAAAAGATRIVFASTSDVYATRDAPFVEDDPVDPYTVYGTTKMMSERLLRLATVAQPQLSVSVARLFNVYGPRETNPHVLPEILEQLKRGGSAVRLGNLWPLRDFVFVEDVADAFIALTESAARFDVFNVGTGVVTSIGEAVTAIAGLMSLTVDVVADPERTRPVERKRLHADATKIQRALGWRPRHTFAEGMTKWLVADGLLADRPGAVPGV